MAATFDSILPQKKIKIEKSEYAIRILISIAFFEPLNF